MAYFHPAAVAHRRKLYMRHDAWRLARPGKPEAKMPGWADPSATQVRLKESREEEVRAAFDAQLAELRAGHDRATELLAEIKYELAWRWLCRKYGYNPDQPRDELGRWTDTGSAEDDEDDAGKTDDETEAPEQPILLAASRPKGHHYVNQSLYRNLPLPSDTRAVFDEATTGSLAPDGHGWSRDHSEYNKAVSESFDKFMETRGIRPEAMTPDEARSFVQDVMKSDDPRIRDFNKRLLLRSIPRRLPALLWWDRLNAMPKNEHSADRQDVEWQLLYKKIGGWLGGFGTESAVGEADFWVLDDNWGSQQQKVLVNKLPMLRPEIIEGLRKLLRDFPHWEIVVAVDLGGDGKDWPDMGLTIRADEIIDGLQRAYFPREFQSLHYEASRVGTEFD